MHSPLVTLTFFTYRGSCVETIRTRETSETVDDPLTRFWKQVKRLSAGTNANLLQARRLVSYRSQTR